MKKILFILFGLSVFGVAFAAGENVPTSKSYVDSKLAEKQDTIPANDGATQVLTNTGTAGDYDTKGIYDAAGEYATQTQNLVDAATMNAGVQNAIDSEFQCIEYDENNECLLMDVFGQTQTQSPNVFDASQILNASGWAENNGVYSGTISNLYRLGNMNACTPGPCKENTIYTLSYTISVDENATPSCMVQPWLYIRYSDGTATNPPYYSLPSNPGDTSHIVLVSSAGKTISHIRGTYHCNAPIHISNIQLQEGTTATPYVPYGNLYLPNGE